MSSLSPGVKYDWSISATAPYFSTGTASGVFYNPDISLSMDKEVYTRTFVTSHPGALCDSKIMTYTAKAQMPGEVLHDHGTTDSTSWTPFYFNSHLDTRAVDCGLTYWVKLKHLTVALFANDDNAKFVYGSPWMAGQDLQPANSAIAMSGNIAWTVNFGAGYGPFTVGATASAVGGINSLTPSLPRKDNGAGVQSDGSLWVGTVDVEWNPSEVSYGLDVTFQMAVFNVAAQSHYLDHLRFTVAFFLTYAETNWLGYGWTNFAGYTIVLGDRYVYGGATAGSADGNCDLQAGTQTISGFPGWP